MTPKPKLSRLFGLLPSAEGLSPDDPRCEGHCGIRFKRSPDPKRTPALDSFSGVGLKLIKRTSRPGMLGPGDTAPSLEVIRPDGSVQSLEAFRGKPLLIFMVRVMSTQKYCPFCLPGLEQLDEMIGEFQQRGVEVMIVGASGKEECAEFREAIGLKLPIHADPQWNVFKAYDAGTFASFPLHAWALLDAGGIVKWVWRMTGPDPERALPMPSFALDRIDEFLGRPLAAA
jgi:peroxiredoxin